MATFSLAAQRLTQEVHKELCSKTPGIVETIDWPGGDVLKAMKEATGSRDVMRLIETIARFGGLAVL